MYNAITCLEGRRKAEKTSFRIAGLRVDSESISMTSGVRNKSSN
jgi:hypothetical protein